MTFRVLTAELAHETNTFNCRVTDAQSFRDHYVLKGDDAVRARSDANTELAGWRNRLSWWTSTKSSKSCRCRPMWSSNPTRGPLAYRSRIGLEPDANDPHRCPTAPIQRFPIESRLTPTRERGPSLHSLGGGSNGTEQDQDQGQGPGKVPSQGKGQNEIQSESQI